MLIFFDESFRKSQTIAIKQEDLSQIFTDVFALKSKHFGIDIARKMEIKGSEIFKSFAFRLEKKAPNPRI